MRVHSDLSQLPDFQNAVLTIGSFDGVHSGHLSILRQVQALAQECGGESVVITFDPHPRTVLAAHDQAFRLITTTEEKIALLANTGLDHVVVVPFSEDFSRLTARQYVEDFLLQKFKPRYIVIGYDHRFGHDREGDLAFLKKYEEQGGFQVVEIPAQVVDDLAVSSSQIRKHLTASEISQANRLLGHPFSFTGTVVRGNQIGRTIGFPTANLELDDPHKLRLPEGIYAARVAPPSPPGGGEAASPPPPLQNGEGSPVSPPPEGLGGALYIGTRPTLEGQHQQVIEVNILDFDGDLYDQRLTVEVLDFIRPDKKLDGLEALKTQIEADKQEILRRLTRDGGRETVDGGRRDRVRVSAIRGEPSAVHPQPSAVIVILNYNTRQHLQEYLPSVVAYSAGAKIIVADNGSPDDSIEFLQREYPEVEVVDLHRNYGFAQGYNEALQRIRSAGTKPEFYIILNSDVEVTPGWTEPVLAAMQADPSIGIAQPKILAWLNKSRFEHAGAAGGWMDGLGYPFCRGRLFNHVEEDIGQHDQPQECFWAAGAAFFIRADLYHAFKGFDGDYFAHNEEIDLCWRVKRAGYSVWCIPQSVVYHLGGGTLGYENPRKIYLNFRNSLFTLLKNESAGKLLWLIPARLLLDGVAAMRFAAKRQFRAIWAILRGHFSMYRQWGEVMRKRRDIAQIVEKERIGPDRSRAGVFRGSIVVAHYLRRVKNFSDLF